MTTYLGIDNGLSGALAFYDGVELMIYDMPVFEIGGRKAINEPALQKIILTDRPAHVILEELTPLPKVGKLQSFSMGQSQGIMRGLFTAFDIPYTLIRPAHWKKAMACPKDKDASRKRASELLPSHSHNWERKEDDGRAEAALLALMAYEKYK